MSDIVTEAAAPATANNGANGVHAPEFSTARWLPLPDHTQLPDSDGEIVENILEHPQGFLLTSSVTPVLSALHPDGNYSIGHDTGIYWDLTDPPLKGCKAPDWFYVPGVPPQIDGVARRSFVIWKDRQRPLIAIEYVSKDGSDELDQTPNTGKFWVYERGIMIPYYIIWDAFRDRLRGFHLADFSYRAIVPNERGRLFIPPLNLELGVWKARFQNLDGPWLRWFDVGGAMLPSADEREELEAARAEQERMRADQEKKRADAAQQRNDKLAAKLRELGLNPDEL